MNPEYPPSNTQWPPDRPQPFMPPVVPPYGTDVELLAIEALCRLTPEQAARVLRWAASRFEKVQP